MAGKTHSNFTAPSSASARAAQCMLPMVYDELRARAAQLLAGQRAGHTLQRTALVHEAYLKLDKAGMRFETPLHLIHAAARAMRQILLDHAAARGRHKRCGGRARVDLDDVVVAVDQVARFDFPALDAAMDELERSAPRQAQVVVLRFFAGLDDTQTARLLGISERTIRRDWQAARAWLYQQMRGSGIEPQRDAR